MNPNPDLTILTDLINALSGEHNFIVTVLAWMASARLVFKPISLAVLKYVEVTPSLKDNEILEKIENNKFLKLLSWLLDYATSIKVPTNKPTSTTTVP